MGYNRLILNDLQNEVVEIARQIQNVTKCKFCNLARNNSANLFCGALIKKKFNSKGDVVFDIKRIETGHCLCKAKIHLTETHTKYHKRQELPSKQIHSLSQQWKKVEIFSKLTIKTPERSHWRHLCSACIADFEQVKEKEQKFIESFKIEKGTIINIRLKRSVVLQHVMMFPNHGNVLSKEFLKNPTVGYTYDKIICYVKSSDMDSVDCCRNLLLACSICKIQQKYFQDAPLLCIVFWSDHRNRYLYKQMHFKDISQTFQRNFLSDLFEYECTEDEIQKGLDDLTVTLKNNSNVKEDENSFYFNKKDLTPGQAEGKLFVVKHGQVTDVVRLLSGMQNVLEDSKSCSSVLQICSTRDLYKVQSASSLLNLLTDAPKQFYCSYEEIVDRPHAESYKMTSWLSERSKELWDSYKMKYGSQVEGPLWEKTIDEVTTASLKLDVSSTSLNKRDFRHERVKLALDFCKKCDSMRNEIKKLERNRSKAPLNSCFAIVLGVFTAKITITAPEDGYANSSRSSLFILYNYARLSKILQHFDERVKEGMYKPMMDLTTVNFTLLKEENEWNLILRYVLYYPILLMEIIDSCKGGSAVSKRNVFLSQVYQFLFQMVHDISTYYHQTKVLLDPQPHLEQLTHARLQLVATLKKIMEECFEVLGVEAPTQM